MSKPLFWWLLLHDMKYEVKVYRVVAANVEEAKAEAENKLGKKWAPENKRKFVTAYQKEPFTNKQKTPPSLDGE